MLIRFIMLMALNLPGPAQRNEGPTAPEFRGPGPGRLTAPPQIRLHAPEGPVFRRTSKADAQPVSLDPKGPGAKGRPTPTRKEAEAAARERAKAGMDKKAAQKLLRERRAESNAKMREGMRSGDERYLPGARPGAGQAVHPQLRRRSPLHRGVPAAAADRDHDPPVLRQREPGGGQQPALGRHASWWSSSTPCWMLFRLKRALRAKFPDESLKGTTFYTILRVLQLRWLRMPKPQVKIGGAPR